MPRPRGSTLSEQHKQRVGRGLRRYHQRKRDEARLRPSDLRALTETGVKGHATVRPALVPFLAAGAIETASLILQLGGPDDLPPAKRMLAEDVGRLGALVRALVTRFAETADPDIASRCATLVNARRQHLLALGLEHAQREVPSLDHYLSERADKPPSCPRPENPTPGRGVAADTQRGELSAARRPSSTGPRRRPQSAWSICRSRWSRP